jgi:hypothetical protein
VLRYPRLNHRFVDYLPEALEPGFLYVSITYATAAHKCCCGCGLEVVTPITPTDWQLGFDGDSLSLNPSIGNWNFPCRSHYFIERGRVVDAPPWSDAEVAAERERDRRAKARYYNPLLPPPKTQTGTLTPNGSPPREGFWQMLRRWLGGH